MLTHSKGWFLAFWFVGSSTPLSVHSDLIIGLRLLHTAGVGELEQSQHPCMSTNMYVYMYMYTVIGLGDVEIYLRRLLPGQCLAIIANIANYTIIVHWIAAIPEFH